MQRLWAWFLVLAFWSCGSLLCHISLSCLSADTYGLPYEHLTTVPAASWASCFSAYPATSYGFAQVFVLCVFCVMTTAVVRACLTLRDVNKAVAEQDDPLASFQAMLHINVRQLAAGACKQHTNLAVTASQVLWVSLFQCAVTDHGMPLICSRAY